MAAISTINSASTIPTVALNPSQEYHFTEGNGVYLADENGGLIDFVHMRHSYNPQQGLEKQESIKEATAMLEMLRGLVINRSGSLELNETASSGLELFLSEITARMC